MVTSILPVPPSGMGTGTGTKASSSSAGGGSTTTTTPAGTPAGTATATGTATGTGSPFMFPSGNHPHNNSKVAPRSPFGTSLDELRQINQEQMTEENVKALQKMGGIQALAQLLCVNLEHGLPKSEITEQFVSRREFFGCNVFIDAPMKKLWQLWVEALQDTTLLILIAASIASTITGYLEHPTYGWMEGLAIILGVFLVATVTAVNDYSKEKQFRQLSARNDDVFVKVQRDGKMDSVPITDINVGDIVVLDTGDKVPADAVLIRGSDVKCNESSLTGEPDDVTKSHDQDPFLLSSCLMASGHCECLVIAVGLECRWGKIKSKLVREHKDTPLMEKLEVMAKYIGYVGMFFSIATMAAMMIIFAVSPEKREQDSWVTYILHVFLIGVVIIVVAIPEGLPLAVTMSLSYSTKKMLLDNNLIRVLAACETMGSVTSICSDKTGTLTENKMTVVEGWILGEYFTQDALKQDSLPVNPKALRRLSSNVAVNTSAFLKETDGLLQVQGSKTEGALLLWMAKVGFSYAALRKENFQPQRGDRLFPFSSEKKTMSAIVHKKNNKYRLYSKGAAEVIVSRSSHYVKADGSIVPLDETVRNKLNSIIQTMAESALRTISVAHRDFDEGMLPNDLQLLLEAPEENLVVNAIFGIMDPLRSEVSEAIRDCQRAGIMVRMVTGDNIHTARAIATRCGILTPNGVSLDGPVFRNMNKPELDRILPRLQVLARSSPADKFRLVTLLQERCEVVGVTGDGTNDAPALRAADVGMAMGVAGTDLAKEASDIIIMDDRFSSIRRAVLWGRCVYENIRKFLQFQLTVNIVALVVSFVSAVAGKDPPLNSVMMLWINLIMDAMGALALGTEQPTDKLLDRRPYKKTAPLLSAMIIKNVIVQAVFQLILLFTLLEYGAEFFNVPEGNYCASATFTFKSASSFPDLAKSNCVLINGTKCDELPLYKNLTCPFFNQAFANVTIDTTNPALLPVEINSTYTGLAATQILQTELSTLGIPHVCLKETCHKYDYRHYTLIFNTFVFCQVFNEVNARKTTSEWQVFNGLLKNQLFVIIIVITIMVQVVIAELGGRLTKTSSVTFSQWLICFGFGSLSLPVGIIMRLIPISESKDSFANPNNLP